MATRGYQSYRGRNHGKLALVIVLVLTGFVLMNLFGTPH